MDARSVWNCKVLGVWDGSCPVLDTVAGRPVFCEQREEDGGASNSLINFKSTETLKPCLPCLLLSGSSSQQTRQTPVTGGLTPEAWRYSGATMQQHDDGRMTRTARFDARWVIGNPGSRLFLGPSFLGGLGFHTLAVKEETACAGAEELFQKEQGGEGPGCSHGYSLLTAYNRAFSGWQAQNSAQETNVVNRGRAKVLSARHRQSRDPYWNAAICSVILRKHSSLLTTSATPVDCLRQLHVHDTKKELFDAVGLVVVEMEADEENHRPPQVADLVKRRFIAANRNRNRRAEV
ncbi:hypothetical protein NA56DRAFT_703086 [Hyaloscypha hepaticicola]|uniref:Uncharacterized protein n=1 Tax=Hyaloscypha hepaticicola TaxID=2082293 RepID=A0A2J6Q753_9HELO|nr:hypothetical protein NA56DRAFT_703086 [Hyaloscypha hepaticicola]